MPGKTHKLAKIFAENVKFALAREGWSHARLAREMGISGPSLADTLSGGTPPGLERVEKISQILGIPAADLLRSANPPPPKVVHATISQELRQETAEIARQAATEAVRTLVSDALIVDIVAALASRPPLNEDERRHALNSLRTALNLPPIEAPKSRQKQV